MGPETAPIWDSALGESRAATDVFDELVATVPLAEPTVIVHGDASVPNVIIRDGELAGIVDVGLLGPGET